MGGGWWEPSDISLFTPISLKRFIMEERWYQTVGNPLWGPAASPLCWGVGFFAFELTLREEQKQDLGEWESGKGRAASFTTASHHNGIWRYIQCKAAG